MTASLRPTTVAHALRADFRAPRQARRLVYAACARAELPQQLVDDAAIVAGELVLHCLRRGGAPVHPPIGVEIRLGADDVTVRVRDTGPASAGSPVPSGPVGSWEVVKRLAASFGYRADASGREAWAVVRTPPGAACA